jgi:hypothetical protein
MARSPITRQWLATLPADLAITDEVLEAGLARLQAAFA